MRHTLKATAMVAFLLLGLLPAARAQTFAYSKNPDGTYRVTATFPDGVVLAWTAVQKPSVPPTPTPQPPAAPKNFKVATVCPCLDPETDAGHVCDCPAGSVPHLHLSWDAPTVPVDSYELQRATTPIATPAGGATSYVDSAGLSWDTGYTYRIRAKKGTLASGWVAASGKTGSKPPVVPPDPGEGGPGGGTDPPPVDGVVTVLEARPNVSSVVLRVQPVAGAKDYWVYDPAEPTKKKASGGNTIVEYNGKGANLVVEALDSLAPDQPHTHLGMPPNLNKGVAITNGQGAQAPPTELPVKVLARSATIPVTYKPAPVPAAGGIFDGFDGEGAAITKKGDGQTFLTATTADGLWSFKSEKSDYTNTDIFLKSFHPMIMQVDGPSPGHGVANQENSNTNMVLNRAFDFSGGKVLHVYVEWDAHFDKQNRRWFKLLVWPGNEQLLTAVNIDEDFLGHEKIKHTTSGRLLLARIDGQAHTASVVKWNAATATKDVQELTSWSWDRGGKDRGGPLDRNRVYAGGKTLNGGTGDIDLRHGFHWYISENRMVAYEVDPLGVVVKQYDVPIPGGLGYSTARVGFGAYLYHSQLGRQELIADGGKEFYWIDRSQKYAHMAHIDNVLCEVLPGFPP